MASMTMTRRTVFLAGLLVLQKAAVSAEYLRERQSRVDGNTLADASRDDLLQHDSDHVSGFQESNMVERRDKVMGFNALSAYDGVGAWDTFLADGFTSMSFPSATPSRKPSTSKPTRPPKTPRPTSVTTKAPVSPRPTTAPVAEPRPSTAPQSPRPSLAPQTNRPTLAPIASPNIRPSPAPVPLSSAPSVTPPTLASVSPSQRPSRAVSISPSTAPSGTPGNTLLDIINTTPSYSTFAEALELTNQATTVDTDLLTVFAPDNNAMSDRYITNTLLPNVNYRLHLSSLVRNHLTNQGVYTTANLTDGLQLTMIGREVTNVTVSAANGISLDTFAARLGYTDPVPLQQTDIIASNGVLHEVGTVLYPAWSFVNLMSLLGLLEDRFSTLISLLESSGLAQTLQNARNLTLIAPTNDAFAALPPQVLTQLSNPANVDELTEVLLYHVVPGVINFEILPTGDTIFSTEQGEDVTVSRRQRPNGSVDLFFNGNRSSTFYLTRLNIMYQIDQVLLPPSFGGTLGPTAAPAPSPAPTPSVPSTATLATLIASNPNYSTLLNLLKEGNLLNTLNQTNSGPFTIYAPTNTAFDALGDAYLTALATPGYALHLSSLLLDHVQNGRVTRDQLVDGLVITMANGLAVTVSNDGTSIELITSSVDLGETPAITVVPPETNAQNGVLHQVDSVILPFWFFFNPTEALAALPDTFGTFSSLINQAGLTSVFDNLVAKTIVGPNDAAFRNLPADTLAFLTDTNNLPILSQVLVYHVLEELLAFPSLNVGAFNESTLLGEDVLVNVTENASGGKLLSFNGVSGVGRGFYLTKDNIIYEVGGVLIPPSLQNVIP